ncbi:L-2,4-diaminobutyrate decarboxylase [Defluviimonas aquaemixtae]|uniref:L-2,4-diaminobutyrate decarboxylase n=1 Tax=Albidovulum aquaemixtae TaxID=1542388 RepID=A0A2R8BJL6_9RHOB|nr:pyridoxal-dependent decarboxylase [Defluviimonas aquaemixtae]SPH23491.1 L-2,4-diaminobutyrate decarboxylase [Defluviimonas aquaemixtae]
MNLEDTGTGLFPTASDRERIDAELTRMLAASRTGRRASAVTPGADLAAYREALAAVDFAAARDLTDLLGWTVAALETGIVHMTHPSYFGLFNPAPTFPSECADRIAAAFNPQLAVWSHAPVCVEIEAHMIRAVAARAGLPDRSGGHFTSGGAEANATALTCALTQANDGFGSEGVFAFSGRPVFYASAESHLAWLKIAHQAGIGREAARLVATDGSGRMDAGALVAAIERDIAAGCVPVMIAATAGTTNAGMIDPLRDCARIAAKHDLWLHVDAAWAGAMIASPILAPLLDGIVAADSVTIDAHKWFATTMGCGMFLTARPEVLSQAFQVSASYMPSNLPSTDPYVNSIQWSRRFLGLRLFLSLASVGWAGYAAHVEHAVTLVQQLADRVCASRWTVANDPSAGVLCLHAPDGAPPPVDIVRDVLGTGEAWLSVAKLEGTDVVRVCATNGMTSAADIDALAVLLDQAAKAQA